MPTTRSKTIEGQNNNPNPNVARASSDTAVVPRTPGNPGNESADPALENILSTPAPSVINFAEGANETLIRIPIHPRRNRNTIISSPGSRSPASSNEDCTSHEFLNINTLFKFIKIFDGDRDKLIPFLNNCDAAFNLATAKQVPILLAYVKTQLTGKAESACSNHIFHSWTSLKEYLKTMYSDKKTHGHLLMELLSCKQQSSETITQFMLRIETSLKKILTSVHQGNHDPRELPGRLASMNDLALHTFILNVKPQISQILRAREINTLNEAFNFALEEEKVSLLLDKHNHKKKYCNFCKKSGHNIQNCFKQQSQSSYKNSAKQKSTILLTSTNKEVIKICRYCKNKGHEISECRKRMWVNSKGISKSGSSNANPQSYSSNTKPQSNTSNTGNIQTLDVTAATNRELDQFAAINLN